MKLLVLDGNSILNRAFYGIKVLTTKAGDYTNGIYGFLTMLNKLLEETAPDGVAIAFDQKAPTFRHKAYAGYKSNRKGMPEELAQQMPVLEQLLVDLGYRTVSCEGWEADDILGTLSAQCQREGAQCLIATGDRDSLQLVSGSTSVRLATTKFGQPQVTLYDVAKIQEDYGVTPRQLIDIKAIQGDSSDCIPGVAGIGPKGAGELIQKFGSVQYIYDHLEELDIKPELEIFDCGHLHNLGYFVKSGILKAPLPLQFMLGVTGAEKPAPARIFMHGQPTFKFAVKAVPYCIDQVLEKAGMAIEDVDFFVFHQANARIIDLAAKKYHIPPEKYYKNIQKYGNTSAASIPLVISELHDLGKVGPGSRVLVVGFGGGLTWGGALVEFA